ncbi:hypothetical protein Tco_0245669 [Tanacetum coccineum]
MAGDNGFVNLEQLRPSKIQPTRRSTARRYFDMKTQSIDEEAFVYTNCEQRLPTNVRAYKTREELKGLQKDDMIKAMEMRTIALQLHL